MIPKRIAVKIFASPDPGPDLDLSPAIGLFHRLIQSKGLEGLLLDVADYAHVPEGPGVVLIGHDVDYGVDQNGGRTGLLVTRKRFGDLPLAEAFRDALRKGLLAVAALDKDGALPVQFAAGSFNFQILDRLAAPNSSESFEAVKAEIAPVLQKALDGATHEVVRASADDPRKPLTLSVTVPDGVDAGALLARLGGA